MKIFMTGATGFVGKNTLPALLGAGHEVQALVRPDSLEKIPPSSRNHDGFSIFEGDLLDRDRMMRAGEGCEAIVHLAGVLGKNHSGVTIEAFYSQSVQNMICLAERIRVRRFVHMSALGARENAQSRYFRANYHAEYFLKNIMPHKAFPWVIFRPSYIFGPGDELTSLLQPFLRTFLPAIVPGTGKTLLQPVAIESIVQGVVKALESDEADGKIYEIGGPNRLTLDEIIDRIAEAMGRSPCSKIHVPFWVVVPLMNLVEKLPLVSVTKDQIVMLGEDNICDTRSFYSDFGIEPQPFTVESLKRYV